VRHNPPRRGPRLGATRLVLTAGTDPVEISTDEGYEATCNRELIRRRSKLGLA